LRNLVSKQSMNDGTDEDDHGPYIEWILN